MTIHIIHGIHTSEGKVSTPALLIPEIEAAGYPYQVHKYGYVLALTSRFLNAGRAEKIAPSIKEGDYILAHSNGADVTRIMLRDYGIKPAGIILLQPALDVDTEFAKGNYWIKVFYNEDDKAVLAARWMLWFDHPYGAMGRYGYKGDDLRVTSYNTRSICPTGGHSLPYEISKGLREYVIASIGGMDRDE
jgi:hypothetical protein